jgi:protein involved in polysaccharide export with SLBB domain
MKQSYLKLLCISIGLFLLGSGILPKWVMAQEAATVASDDPIQERFKAGQALSIKVPLDTGSILKGGYPIDSSGYVEIPVLGRLFVAEKTRGELETYLSEKLSNYLKDTHIQVTPCIRITMLGFWVHQGQYYMSPSTTVWEAVLRAGGIGGERNLDKITVQRGSQVTNIAFLDAYSREITLAKAGIHSGDLVIIPIPRDNTGFWYWFQQSLGVTAQLASVAGGVLSIYLTYTLIQNGTINGNGR